MVKHQHYDAYTGLSFSTKSKILKFLGKHTDESWGSQTSIEKAVEYALKEIPSFGGFILTAEEEGELIAVMIVNKTGMGGIVTEYVAVLQVTRKIPQIKVVVRKMEEKAIKLAQGDISLLVKDFGPKEVLLEQIEPAATFRPLKRAATASGQIKASA